MLKRIIKYGLGIIISILLCGFTVSATEYTVLETNAILYSNVETILYTEADINSQIILTKEEFPDNIPVQVTGITSNGFFRISLEGTYYIPGYGLQSSEEAVDIAHEIIRPTPIDIVGYRIGINSVGGIPVYIHLQNTSDKIINSIDFTITPYNAIGKKQKCSIRGYSTHVCSLTGPINPNEEGSDIYTGYGRTSRIFDKGTENAFYISENRRVKYTEKDIARTFSKTAMWDCVWYNGSIETISIDKIKVYYADGTSETVKPSDVITEIN